MTHGGAQSFVIARFLELPLAALRYARFHVRPGSITVLAEDDHFHNRTLRTLGDTSHLG